ncbi:NADH:flavin oxidoreductase [Clostridium sp. KNHs205]|jgi:2,4-dienoyl-CoA reductase-like NADH-dependent reductase (Old Yellow Enzyme family)|uniref:NADH:flavin oxidoreductase n=1 Tax=Clostridium sp. KNHs205 TaxID=1449050 RepID=UPI00051AAF6E|nr:NADH:flavin oxidoreductase [Clostridium sp. KNHs205]
MLKVYNSLQIKNIVLKNRIVMAPMVRFGYTGQQGIMSEKLLQHYLNYADKGIGLIISQALTVTPGAKVSDRAGAYSDEHIGYLRELAKEYHKNDTVFLAQLAFPGFGFYDTETGDVNELTINELERIRDQFINAARICRDAGLDGIELHGAHTYFLNMMASELANKRTDRYGGGITGRLTLVKEIIEGIKSFSDDNFILAYRMGWGESLEIDTATAQALEDLGIDLLHVSAGIPQDRRLQLPDDFSFNDIVYTGSYVKEHVNIPVIVVNDIKTLDRGNTLIESNLTDLVAYGKPFLADESFVINSSGNLNFKSCMECRKCQWFIDGEKCPARKKPDNLKKPIYQ